MAEIIEKTGKSYNIFDKINNVWNKISFWHKASDCEFDDGKTAQTKLGAINGITSDLTGEAEDIAASIKCVNQLNSSLTNYKGYGESVALDNVTSESNPFTVPTNGMLVLGATGTSSYIYAKIESFGVGTSSNLENGVGNVVVPVFKGMKLYETTKTGTNSINFIPFKK